MPDVEYSYFLAKMKMDISVTETIVCVGDVPTYVITPSTSILYSSDTSKRFSIKIKDIEGFFAPFADSSISFSYFDDGRLKGINQSTTGQGEAILKAAASLAGALIAGGGAPKVAEKERGDCATIRSVGGDKGVTLFYRGTISSENLKDVKLKLEEQSVALHEKVAGIVPQLELAAVPNGDSTPPRATFLGNVESSGIVPLTLQKTELSVVR